MAHSEEQLRHQLQAAQDAEQISEAYAVQVVLGEREAGVPTDPVHEEPDPDVRLLVLMIANRGKYTITRVEAQFSPDGKSLVSHHRSERLPGLDNLPDRLRAGQPGKIEAAYGNSLTPWDSGMRFESDRIHVRFLSYPYAVIRWTDRWGQRWEHKKGEVRKTSDTEQWMP